MSRSNFYISWRKAWLSPKSQIRIYLAEDGEIYSQKQHQRDTISRVYRIHLLEGNHYIPIDRASSDRNSAVQASYSLVK